MISVREPTRSPGFPSANLSLNSMVAYAQLLAQVSNLSSTDKKKDPKHSKLRNEIGRRKLSPERKKRGIRGLMVHDAQAPWYVRSKSAPGPRLGCIEPGNSREFAQGNSKNFSLDDTSELKNRLRGKSERPEICQKKKLCTYHMSPSKDWKPEKDATTLYGNNVMLIQSLMEGGRYDIEHCELIALPRPSRFYIELGPPAAARWPAGLQVLNGRITHIPYVPPKAEPLATPKYTASLIYIQLRKFYKTVFSYHVDCGPKYVRSYVGINHPIGENDMNCIICSNLTPDTLLFESRFESGNLFKAVQVGEFAYELHLRSDLYSKNWSQWYYFQIRNTRPNQEYRFAIVNCGKTASLYTFGMKPLMYSERLAKEKDIGWHRVGEEIVYVKTSIGDDNDEFARHTLKWTVTFPYANDRVYFADSYPYTYSDLQDYLRRLMNDPIKSQYCALQILCRSLAGNNIYLLTISSPCEMKKKRAIILTARVHPGESASSWVMKGFIDYLTSNTPLAQELRESFVFKLVPMLNPDGVIVGNNRCGLSGRDLNRCYRSVRKDAYPGPWHVRRMVQKIQVVSDVILYCDLHGHCRKHNMFVYGCENPDPAKHLKEQIFPLLLQQNAPDLFSFLQCRFLVEKQREGTGRVVMWSMGVTNSYTLEVSFAGATVGRRWGTHFHTGDYERMSHRFCETVLDYFDKKRSKNLVRGFHMKFQASLLKYLRRSGSTAADPVMPDPMFDPSPVMYNTSDKEGDLTMLWPKQYQQQQPPQQPKNIDISDILSPKHVPTIPARQLKQAQGDALPKNAKEVPTPPHFPSVPRNPILGLGAQRQFTNTKKEPETAKRETSSNKHRGPTKSGKQISRKRKKKSHAVSTAVK